MAGRPERLAGPEHIEPRWRVNLVKVQFLKEGTPSYAIHTKYWLADRDLKKIDTREAFEELYYETLFNPERHPKGWRADTSESYHVKLSLCALDLEPSRMVARLNALPCCTDEAVVHGAMLMQETFRIRDLPIFDLAP